MQYRFICLAVAISGGLSVSSAQAQSAATPSISFQGETDHRERGLSWSDGKPAMSASATIPATYDLALDIDAVTLRESARHGGADVGLTITPRYTVNAGGWDLTGGVRGNVFIGRAGTSYVEVTGDIARSIGPAQFVVGAAFAPAQDAIGGHNLYVNATASVSLPGTPLTLYGGVGHTSGSDRADLRVARLRPGGDSLDHHFGVEHTSANLALGVRYSGTSIGADEVDPLSRYYDRDYGSRVVAYIRFTP